MKCSLKWLALLAALLPFLALHLSFINSVREGIIPWCNPYLDGCSSISKAARQGNSIFIFRALMMPYAAVMCFYWIACWYWLKILGDTQSVRPKAMLVLGILGAMAVLVYVDFLGSSGAGYRLMRKYGVIFFFSLTGFAQFLLLSRLYALSSQTIESIRDIRAFMLAICFTMLAIGLLQILVSVIAGESDFLENSIEWSYGLLLMFFGWATFKAWDRLKFQIRFEMRSS